jgi:hypothetical protein
VEEATGEGVRSGNVSSPVFFFAVVFFVFFFVFRFCFIICEAAMDPAFSLPA